MKKVSIIGAGQLGSRHLQGLMTAQTEMEVWVVEQSCESLKIAKERCEQITQASNKTVHYNESIDELPEVLDFVIVATGSKPRASIVKALLEHSTVKYIVLEKFLFTKMKDYDEVGNLLKEKNVKCWVNCPRRMWPVYEEIKKLINPNEPVMMIHNGKNWGLCCNTVHRIDLWMFLAGDCDFMVDMTGVEPKVVESKRNGYIELLGTEKFESVNGDKMELGSFMEYDGPTGRVIRNAGNEIVVEEEKGKWFFNGEEHTSATPFQSGLTGILADEILNTGDCRLSPYSVSIKYHKPYLKAAIDFVNKVQGTMNDSCPIT